MKLILLSFVCIFILSCHHDKFWNYSKKVDQFDDTIFKLRTTRGMCCDAAWIINLKKEKDYIDSTIIYIDSMQQTVN